MEAIRKYNNMEKLKRKAYERIIKAVRSRTQNAYEAIMTLMKFSDQRRNLKDRSKSCLLRKYLHAGNQYSDLR